MNSHTPRPCASACEAGTREYEGRERGEGVKTYYSSDELDEHGSVATPPALGDSGQSIERDQVVQPTAQLALEDGAKLVAPLFQSLPMHCQRPPCFRKKGARLDFTFFCSFESRFLRRLAMRVLMTSMAPSTIFRLRESELRADVLSELLLSVRCAFSAIHSYVLIDEGFTSVDRPCFMPPHIIC